MAKFIVKPTGPFRKDLKLAKRRNLPLSDISLYCTGTHADIFGKGKKR